MKPPLFYLLVPCCALFASCASQLSHQTSESEPHASVSVVRKSELAKSSVVSIDGIPVKAGASYRLRPGGHTVEIEYKQTVTAQGRNYGMMSSPPVDLHVDAYGKATTSGGDPFSRHVNQPVNFSVDERRFHKKSIPFQVEAGKSYRLQGDLIHPCRKL